MEIELEMLRGDLSEVGARLGGEGMNFVWHKHWNAQGGRYINSD